MKRIPLLILLASLAFPLAQAKPKKLQVPSALFREARYVYVECPDGGPLTPGLLPEDLQAISDVEAGIHNWSRYVVTPKRDQAELIFVVRAGRVVTAGGHVGVSLGNHSADRGVGPGDTSQPNNAGGGAEVGSPDDLLFIYARDAEGKLGAPIWMRSEHAGLRSHNVPLLEEVRNEVDAAYPMK